jgi:hypothetical protein
MICDVFSVLASLRDAVELPLLEAAEARNVIDADGMAATDADCADELTALWSVVGDEVVRVVDRAESAEVVVVAVERLL